MRRASFAAAAYELFSSMRFAISLLTIVAIASIIGTILKQNEPYANYALQFGSLWFEVFEVIGLYDVYHALWFLAILTFLVTSTGVCIYRNTPQMLREMRSFREHATETSLRNFALQASFPLPPNYTAVADRVRQYLDSQGYRFRESQNADGSTVLLAAKKGSSHRLGYILTHSAIIVICLGGLIDGNLPLKFQQLLGNKKIETRDIPQSQVPPISRLPASNLSFRGSITVPEGSYADVVFINVGDGYLVQELPFKIALKKFHIEHYSTGQPRAFASDIVVTDRRGKSVEKRIEVNHPFVFEGVAIYQASFNDGGSRLKLRAWDLLSPRPDSVALTGIVREKLNLTYNDTPYRAEFEDFRVFNIQDFSTRAPASAASNIRRFFDTGSTKTPPRDLRNVGPNFQYKLRDAQGQAREYENYMLPLSFEGRYYMLSGVREKPNDPFRYVRIPLDAGGRIDGFMQLRAAIFDPLARREIGVRFANEWMSGGDLDAQRRARVGESVVRVLDLFAAGGYDELAGFIERVVPKAEQEKAAETYLKILEGAFLHAYQYAREKAALAPAPLDEKTAFFLRDSMIAISDLFLYGSPLYLQLESYEQRQASGLQLTRAPGQIVVYAGFVLLMLGVFAMFYVRERRFWALFLPARGEVLLALSGNRDTLDLNNEFAAHRTAIAAMTQN